jgi:hypothetical protein
MIARIDMAGTVLEGNVIERAAMNNPVVHIRNADDVLIHDNVIESFSAESDVRGRGRARAGPIRWVSERPA